MTRDDLRGKIQTVLGPIAPEALGRTLMHEHVLSDIRPPGTRSDNEVKPRRSDSQIAAFMVSV